MPEVGVSAAFDDLRGLFCHVAFVWDWRYGFLVEGLCAARISRVVLLSTQSRTPSCRQRIRFLRNWTELRSRRTLRGWNPLCYYVRTYAVCDTNLTARRAVTGEVQGLCTVRTSRVEMVSTQSQL